MQPEQWRPTELARRLNDAGFGQVTSTRRLYTLRKAAGLSGRTVNLSGLLAHLITQRPSSAADQYQASKAAAAKRSKQKSAAGRDIGPIPACKNPKRRERASKDFAFALKTYFPELFPLPWSADHLRIIERLQHIVINGGLSAIAMPRGSGKTTISECVAVLAVLFGYQVFVVLIGSEKESAIEMLDSIKMELEENELLAEDFPEAIQPIRALEGIANRCKGQTHQGQRTHILWTQTAIVLPTIEGSQASGAIIRVAGLTGRIRGMKFKRPDGEQVRPGLAICDDPQTDESARSELQSEHREKILAGAVLGLAGPGRKIAAICPTTIISPGDMAARILDRSINPEWQGETTQMVYAWPDREDLWKEYARIRAEGLAAGDNGRAATAFYKKHRKKMDKGAKVAWPERQHSDELSGLQHAWNLRLRNETVFWAEYQNDPRIDDDQQSIQADQITSRVNGLDRGVVPRSASFLTMFIDVQQTMLMWLVAAWSDDFTGHVVSYGGFPDPGKSYYTVRENQKTLQRKFGGSIEAALMQGLEALAAFTLAGSWIREDGTAASIDRCLIDANYQPDLVYQFARRTPHRAIVTPCHGRFVGAATRPFSEYKQKPGDRIGLNWRIPASGGRRTIRHAVFDANFWKSFVLARLLSPIGERGALDVFGEAGRTDHRLLADHWTSEYFVKTEGRGRTVNQWQPRPGHTENHWWDGIVGAAVAASMCGASLEEFGAEAKPGKKKKIRLSDIQKQKRGGRR